MPEFVVLSHSIVPHQSWQHSPWPGKTGREIFSGDSISWHCRPGETIKPMAWLSGYATATQPHNTAGLGPPAGKATNDLVSHVTNHFPAVFTIPLSLFIPYSREN
jgi:hypothetical protein